MPDTNSCDIARGPIDIRARRPTQDCVQCGEVIGALAGSKDAICTNCGYKDPCCD